MSDRRPTPRVGARHQAWRERRRSLAEGRSAARKAEREAALAREEALARSFRRSRFAQLLAPTDPLAVLLPQLRSLLALARAERSLRDRVEQVFEAIGREMPRLLRLDDLPWALLLAGCPWHGAPRAFRAGVGAAPELREAFVRHLLGPWPPPLFLRAALAVDRLAVARVPEEDQWAVSLLGWICRGRSLRAAVGRLLPAGFTRAMVLLFLRAPAGATPIAAVRRAQVAGLGGDPGFASRLLQTRLGRWQGPEREGAWHRVLAWACARPWLQAWPADALADWVTWVEELLEQGKEATLRGRTEASVTREVAAHRQLREADAVPVGPSGLRGFRDGDVVIRELRSARELVQEGQRMGHCVGMYEPLVTARKVAVFSLAGEGGGATIEVILGTRRVVQVKGRHNAAPSPAVLRWVGRWAASNGLAVPFGG
jgi:hypothetical protein